MRDTICKRFDSIVQLLIDALDKEGLLPMYVASVDNNRANFGGTGLDSCRLFDASAHLRNMADKYKNFKNFLLYIIDGSGTLIFVPGEHELKKKTFCSWKNAQQLRWYVVTDVLGRILFVSPVYEGSIDDTTVLKKSFFYS